MASTNKTPKLGLNQWAAGDNVLRADFNADNAKIEGLAAQGTCVSGSFMGDGKVGRKFDVGFRPTCVLMVASYDNSNMNFVFISPAGNFYLNGGGMLSDHNHVVSLTDSGFLLSTSAFNINGAPILYVAFR